MGVVARASLTPRRTLTNAYNKVKTDCAQDCPRYVALLVALGCYGARPASPADD